jgi:hypothetical protein
MAEVGFLENEFGLVAGDIARYGENKVNAVGLDRVGESLS